MSDEILRKQGTGGGGLALDMCPKCEKDVAPSQAVTVDGKTYHEQCSTALKRTV
jgi:hypothetical protein